MKRILLLSLALSFGLMVYSQNAPKLSKDLFLMSAETEYTTQMENPSNFQLPAPDAGNIRAFDPNETQIGLSQYDLWSNTMYSNRMTMWDDGTMAAVWIYGEEATSFPDRGTGYNYYDGTDWGPVPTERVEDRRCGWPSHAKWGAGGEVIVAHNGVEGLELSFRATKGTGDWTQMNYLGPAGLEDDPTWPRIITSGANNEVIHLIYNSYVAYAGQDAALLYSRSTDGGATWDPQDIIFDETGEDYYFEIGADQYVMASNGDNVAILYGGAWHDLFYMKSEDNGDNWEKTVIWQHPYPMFDFSVTIADTFFACDNSAQIAIDNTGKVHVVFGITRVAHWEVGDTYTFYPFIDGVGYWNEDMNRFSNDHNALAPPQYGYVNSELVEDVNYIGWMQDVDGDGEVHLNGWPNSTVDNILSYRELGPSTMPTLTVDDNGNVFVLFASTTETYENGLVNYKHVWARAMDPVGGWGPFMDLTEDISHIFDECIYPQLTPASDGNIHYFYQADITPGLALDDDHGYQDNLFYAGSLPKMDLMTGVADEKVIEEGNVTQNFPNPFSTTATVNVTLENPANLTLEINNLMGQKVFQS
ncbi:MAG: sialidase family protein, partial [Bacteroidota bacterium]|nr:sialidase family protein [Bacteroidota bacterium]